MKQRDTFGARVLAFWEEADPPRLTAPDVDVLDPRANSEAREAMAAYYLRFYPDANERVFMIGINPGRHGGGVTGIPFTDPHALRDHCRIKSSFDPRRELSSEFVYAFIERFGGMSQFARDFYLTAACPFGLTRSNRNLNYYDVPALRNELLPYIVETMDRQIAIGARRDLAIVIGSGTNKTILDSLNAKHQWFERLEVLDHPRYIMQYRRQQLDYYLERYVQVCLEAKRFG
jgi:hypothetical protein